MGRRKSKDFDNEESNYFDELVYSHEDEDDQYSDIEENEEDNEGYESSSILDEVYNIVVKCEIDEFADAVIESISDHSLERLRDRINEYLK